jgi:CheY-like chemotaxis protein
MTAEVLVAIVAEPCHVSLASYVRLRHTCDVTAAACISYSAMTADILVIEDDAIMREAVAEWLVGAGYRVRTAENGDAALASVNEELPALVVTDLHMPGTGGAALIGELKRHHPEIPIIAISGLFESGFGMRAEDVVALGAARALAKPFRRRELLSVVAELLPRGP